MAATHVRIRSIAAQLAAGESSPAPPAAVILAGGGDGDDDDACVVRRATAADEGTLSLVLHYSFARPDDPAEHAAAALAKYNGDSGSKLPERWVMGAFKKSDGQAVASIVAHQWALGTAGGCPVAAVAGVGTLVDYQRRGFLRTMMTQLFQDMKASGQPVAALWASQSAIYQRYGYAEAHTMLGALSNLGHQLLLCLAFKKQVS
eukprot:SAG22_NODE_3_length_48349_cov_158.681180_33_plen_204_part_00